MRRRLVVAVLMVLAASVLAAVVPPVDRAGAQSPSALVSNLGQTATSFQSLGRDLAQSFTTGGNALGYILDSVDVRFYRLSDSSVFASKLTATVRADSSGAPGAAVATLINPAFQSVPNDNVVLSFTAPAGGVRLEASSTYWLVMDSDGTASGDNQFRLTAMDGEGADAEPGFSIGNNSLFRQAASTGGWTPLTTSSLMFRVNGSVNDGSRTVGTEVMVTTSEPANADGRLEVWGGGGAGSLSRSRSVLSARTVSGSISALRLPSSE